MAVSDEEMRVAFDMYDRGGRGAIQSSDLGKAMAVVGLNPTDGELTSMIQKEDPEGGPKGRLGYQSFVACVRRMDKGFSSVKGIIQAFQVFDKEGDGIISGEELKHVLLNLGEKLPPEEVDTLLAEADPESTGFIYYEDFAKMLMD